ncbi:hypothetical protein D3C81_1421650 [compost metagenome]
MVGNDVVVQHLAKLIVRDAAHRPVVRVGCGIADQHVDLAEGAVGFIDQVLQVFLRRDIGGHSDGGAGAMACIERVNHFLAGLCLARRNHYLGALDGHLLGDGAADAARGAGDDGNLARQIEQ